MRLGRVAVVGAGAWGTALAVAAARGGRDVTLWGRDAEQITQIAARRENVKSLPGVTLPERVIAVSEMTRLSDAQVVVMALPAQALRGVAEALALVLKPGTAVVAAAKGIETTTGLFVTDIIADMIPQANVAILSGPSFATDVARGLPTAVTLAAHDVLMAQVLALLLGSPEFRIYHSGDVRGVEIGGAAKNVLAIAAGIVAGAGLGESARAALITRGFAELSRFGEAYGAKPVTLMGLSGLGDLLLTANSPQSRNFALGMALGAGQRLPATPGGGRLAEGTHTAPVLRQLALARGVDMPIAGAVAAILDNALSVRDAITTLIERPQRAEG